MPTPDTLTTAQHQDFDLEVVSGAWPTDISGEVLFSAPLLSGGLPYGIFDFGGIIRLSLTPGTHGAPEGRFAWRARADRDAEQAGLRRHARRVHARARWATPRRSAHRTRRTPRRCPGADASSPPGTPGRPVEMHPGTLEYVAEVGHVDTWGGSSMYGDTVLPFLFSSAHPVADPERDGLWTTKLEPVITDTFGMRALGRVVGPQRDRGEVVAARGHRLPRLHPHRQPDPRLADPVRLGQLPGRSR